MPLFRVLSQFLLLLLLFSALSVQAQNATANTITCTCLYTGTYSRTITPLPVRGYILLDFDSHRADRRKKQQNCLWNRPALPK